MAEAVLDDLIDALRRLPGVGLKSAQRMAFHLLQHDRDGARRLALAWGVHSLHVPEVTNIDEIRALAAELTQREHFAKPGDIYVAIAGIPFGTSGTTNLMHIGVV